MVKWIRPTGSEIETNDDDRTIAACIDMGWELAEDKPKRTRRTKSEIEADNASKDD